jgi:hypothetical protein
MSYMTTRLTFIYRTDVKHQFLPRIAFPANLQIILDGCYQICVFVDGTTRSKVTK